MRRHAKALVATSALLLTLAIGVSLASATAPTVTIEPVTGVTYTGAHFSGKVDPQDKDTNYRFEYSTTPADPDSWRLFEFPPALPAGSGETAVSADFNELTAGVQYSVRLIAENADGKTISAEPHPSFTTDSIPAPTGTVDPPTAITASSAHFSGQVNPQAPSGNPSASDLQWRFRCTPECPDYMVGSVAADDSSHPAEANSTGLTPNTTYEVYLELKNAGPIVKTAPVSFKTGQVPPRAATLYATQTGLDGALLAARVNGMNAPLTYQFEWGTTTAYGQVAPATPQALGVIDEAEHLVTAPIGGLSVGGTYHFRVSVTNTETGVTVQGADRTITIGMQPGPGGTCANAALRQAQGTSGLPNCRAYEMVSPPAKNNNDVYAASSTIEAARDGSAVRFEALAPHETTKSGSHITGYLSRRGTAGWSTTGLSPAIPPDHLGALSVERYLGGADDLSRVILRSFFSFTPTARLGQSNLYLQDPVADRFDLVTPAAPGGSSFHGINISTVSDFTSDLGRVFFENPDQLTPDGVPDTPNLYGYDAASGQIEALGILPNGAVAPGGSALGTGSVGSNTRSQQAIAEDGHSAFFTTPGNLWEAAVGAIYRREGNTTVPVSGTGLLANPTAQFWQGSTDGEKALFTSSEKLTADATTGPENGGKDLYLWRDGGSPQLIDLSAASESPAEPNGAEVLGVLGASDDLSYVYFAARGVLAPGARQGDANVYLWHGGSISFVAGGAAAVNWDLSQGYYLGGGGVGSKLARVTPDGRYLLFGSNESPTGFLDGGHQQLYRYSADTEQMTCISCNPAGGPATSDSSFLSFDGSIVGSPYLVHPMTDDGSRVFFNSAENLVGADTNERLDVYQWEDGVLSLLSGATEDDRAVFADASDDGDSVFFTTASRLVGSDHDGNRDVYVARVGGGLASQLTQPVPPSCVGENCRTSAPALPSVPSAGSASFAGPGDAAPKRAQKKKKKQRKKKAQKTRKKQQKKHARHTTRRHG